MRALLFDIDDTLYDLQEPFRNTFYQYYRNVYDIDINKLFQYERFYSDEIFDAVKSGNISMEDMYAYRIQKAFAEFDIALPREEALRFQKTYEAYQKHIAISPGIRNFLNELGSLPVFCAIISNGMYEHQMDKVRTLGLTRWFPEDRILISESCGYSKPEVQIFQYAEKKWNLDPDDTWYIGDTFQNDIEGPKTAGWHAVWYNHRQYDIPENAPVPDAVVTTEEQMTETVLKLAGA